MSRKEQQSDSERSHRKVDGSHIPDCLPADFSESLSHEFETVHSASDVDSDATASDAQLQPASRFGMPAQVQGMLLLNLGAMLFGSNQVVIKTAEDVLSPVALNALRFGMAALCFAPLLPRALRQPNMLRPSLELGAWLTGALAL